MLHPVLLLLLRVLRLRLLQQRVLRMLRLLWLQELPRVLRLCEEFFPLRAMRLPPMLQHIRLRDRFGLKAKRGAGKSFLNTEAGTPGAAPPYIVFLRLQDKIKGDCPPLFAVLGAIRETGFQKNKKNLKKIISIINY